MSRSSRRLRRRRRRTTSAACSAGPPVLRLPRLPPARWTAILPAASPDAPALTAAVDRALSATMRRVLHHPAFQRLEAAWRGLAFAARRIETEPALQLQVVDLSAEELAADLLASDDLGRSGLYRLLIEQPAEDSHRPVPAALIACHDFGSTPDDAALLARIAQIAARARAPFIATLDLAAAGGVDPAAAQPPADAAAWAALRALPEADHLALAAPRFLLRAPYGRRSDPIERFAFEELDGAADPSQLLWGAPALLAAVLLGQHVLTQGAGEAPGEPLTIDDMPSCFVTDADGEAVAVPATEQLLTERGAQRLHDLGATPVLTRRGQTELRLGGWLALSGSALAGPWSG
jgi:type VI secretion system ImpC/EvpB family protein